MAVRHGYGKIAGADALVFAYDTGDTKNSYKGEPTTNLLSSPDNMTGTGWSLGNVPAEITITGNQPDPFGKNNAILFTVASNGGNYPHIRQIDKITGTTASHTISIWAKSVSGSTRLDLVCFRSSPWNTAFSKTVTLTTEWQKFEVTGTPLDTTGHRIYFMCQNVPSGTATQVLMAYPQVEQKSHATPFVNGTRSATQGLLDLTGTSTIDLSSVNGYNSNAQLEFDGTNDKIDINIDSWIRTVDNITVEGVVEIPSGASLAGGPWAILTDHSTNSEKDGFWWHMSLGGGYTYFRVEDTVYGERGITFSNPTTFSAGNTYHIATVVGNSGVFIYNNGVLVESYNPPFNWADISSSHTASLTIGRTYPGYWLNALIHNLKLYNRVLTAAEIKNNYNNYKSRFNL